MLPPSTTMFAQVCSHEGKFYEENGYVVTKINIEAALDIANDLKRFAGGNGLTIQARSSQPGGSSSFDYDSFLRSASEIGTSLSSGYKLSLAYVVPMLNRCNDTAKSLEVTYRVYHFGISSVASGMDYSLWSPPVKISNKDLSQILLVQPGIGYDSARHVFAGGQMVLHRELKGAIDNFSVVGYGSSSSLQLQANVSGTREWSKGLLRHLDWGLTYVDNDLPTGLYAINQKQLSARFAGISETDDRTGLKLQFGAAVEGGNQQSTGPAVPPSIGVLSSPDSSLKVYLGSSWSHDATSISASYGIQFGSAQSATELDFIKQILNASVSTRFLLMDHHPLAVDGNVRMGLLTSYGATPLSERFFGGNVPNPFVPGDAWVIQSNPMLRSFPAHNLTFSEGPWGGTSFFSINTDISYVVWGRPLVPKQIEAQVVPLLQSQMKTFKSVTADSYVADGQAYQALESVVSSHESSFAELRKRLQAIRNEPGASSDLSSATGDALGDLENIDKQMTSLGKRDASADALSPIFNLVVGEGPWKGYLSDLNDDISEVLSELNQLNQDDNRRFLLAEANELRQLRESALAQFRAIDRTAAEAKAEDSLKFPNHVLSELVNVVNLYSISPTLLLDAARLGPQPSTGGMGTRYGVGPAIRCGLINVDLTVGYSFNVQERAGEPRGAAVLALTFENLF